MPKTRDVYAFLFGVLVAAMIGGAVARRVVPRP